MEKSGKVRLNYLDYARALGILLIIMQHAFQYFWVYNGIVSYIKTFHVTIFFVISGYIAGIRHEKNYTLREVAINRAKSLLIPYVVFSLINSFLKFSVLGLLGGLTKEIVKQELIEFFITGNGTVWFLTTLFWVEILFYLLKGEHENIIYILTGIAFGMIPFFVPQNNISVLIVLRRTMVGYAFFVLGYFPGRYRLLQKIRWNIVGSVILMGTGFLIWKNWNCEMNYISGEFSGMIPALVINICSVSGILFFMYLMDSKMSQIIKFLSYLGQNSLIIMVVHPILLMCYIYPFGGRIASYSEKKQWMAGMILYLVLIALEIPAIELIQRYFPFLIGKKKQ